MIQHEIYAAWADKYISRGYCVIPSCPGTKYPGKPFQAEEGEWKWAGMKDWTRFLQRTVALPTAHEVEHWSRPEWSEAGLCLITGTPIPNRPGYRLYAVDDDSKDTMVGAAIVRVCGESPCMKQRPGGSPTRFYQGPESVGSRSFAVGKRMLVEVLGAGDNCVLPPNIHPDSDLPYAWVGQFDLCDIDPADLPELQPDVLERLAEAMAAFGYSDQPSVVHGPSAHAESDGVSIYRAANDFALTCLQAWVPALGLYHCEAVRRGGYEAVPSWRPSNSGRPVEKRKPSLKIHPFGIVDEGDGGRGYTPINLVMAAMQLDTKAAFMWLRDATGFVVPQQTVPKASNDIFTDEEIEEDEDDLEDESTIVGPDARDLVFENPPGLVGALIDYVGRSSRKNVPIFALGAALSLIGGLAARQYYCGDLDLNASNLYALIIGGTGSGKNRPLLATKQILRESGRREIVHAKLTSEAKIAMVLSQRATSLQVIDEIKKLFRAMANGRVSNSEQELAEAYMELFELGGSEFQGSGALSRDEADVLRPHVALFGATTHVAYHSFLSSELLGGGLMTRMLVLPRYQRVKRNQDRISALTVPDEVVEACRRIVNCSGLPNAGNGNLDNPTVPPEYHVVPMTAAAEAAMDRINAHADKMETKSDKDPLLEAWVRCPAMTERVALIVAIGRYAMLDSMDGVQIEAEDIVWAYQLVSWSIDRFIEDMRNNVSESEFQKQTQKVRKLIEESGEKGILHSALYKRMKNVFNVQQFKAVIEGLVEAKIIMAVETGTTASGGRPSIRYVMRPPQAKRGMV